MVLYENRFGSVLLPSENFVIALTVISFQLQTVRLEQMPAESRNNRCLETLLVQCDLILKRYSTVTYPTQPPRKQQTTYFITFIYSFIPTKHNFLIQSIY